MPLRILLAAGLLCAGLLLTGERAAASSFQVFPPSNLYPRYAADPRGPQFGVMLLAFPSPRIPGSGDQRVGLKLGGRFGLLRVYPQGPQDQPERGWQVDIEAGFTGQFDVEHSLDNVGWDGTYAFLVSSEISPGVHLQLGAKHVSSHVGDEYAERTGRRRIGYTREELAAGAAWAFAPRWRSYAEAGWGYSPRKTIGQEPGRLQLGLEHEAAGRLRGGRLGWYAALDLGSMEERSWRIDSTLQLGLLVPSGDRRWRVGLGYHDGSVPIGEFYQVDEPYIALGLWLDP